MSDPRPLHPDLGAQKFRLGSWTPSAVRAPAFEVIARMQQTDPALQIVATAVALCAECQAIGIDMREVIYVAENMLRDCEGPYTEHIQAIRAYAVGEILRRGE